jgi:hypothetical protein
MRIPLLFLVGLLSAAGCGDSSQPNAQETYVVAKADVEAARAADYSILFVGNSHTSYHDLPNLVCKMIRFREPDKTVHAHVIGVGHLEQVAHDPQCQQQIDTDAWKYVVLQAQKISMSGKKEYSRQEGIDIAKRAKEHHAKVFFYAEWGRKGVAEEGPRTEKIYREMSEAANVNLSPVGRAWEIALAARPDMPLHDADGNHQSSTGAFLSACVLYGSITGGSPAELATFPYLDVSEADRRFMA